MPVPSCYDTLLGWSCTMLAACTTTSLFILDATTLKKPPTSVPVTTALSQLPTATSWAADNSCLFVAGSNEIFKYNTTGYLYSSTISIPSPVTALLSKDGDTLIYSSGNEVSLVESTSGQELYNLELQVQDITLLSLSKDRTLVASSATSGEVHVHSLDSEAPHVVLGGINEKAEDGVKRSRFSGEVTALAFHAHVRTKLLLALGSRVFVYDTSQPAAPLKTILLNKLQGRLVSIACSPFSKTLVAVASSSGSVCLVDIEKENG